MKTVGRCAVLFLVGCGGGNDSLPIDLSVPGVSVIGSGYDVFDNYADPGAIKAAVLDPQKMIDAGVAERLKYEKADFSTIQGTTIQEYSSSLNTTTKLSGQYFFYKGAVETNFASSRYGSTRYSFATVQSNIKKYSVRVKLDVPASSLRAHLTTQARANLNDANFTPAQVFATYGTHVVVGYTVGGRLDYSVSADMSQLGGGSSLRVYAEASFKRGFTSADLASDTITSSNWSTYSSTEQKLLQVYGGASEYGQNIVTSADYDSWIASVSGNPVFTGFTQGGLLPISELCDDPARRAALEAAYATYAAGKTIATSNPRAVVDITVVLGSNTSGQVCPGGYELLNIDLNENAAGEWIWLCCKLGPDTGLSQPPIDRIYTVDTTDGESAIYGGTKIDVDLNKGNNGDKIYLYYTRGSTKPVRGIQVYDRNNGYHAFSTSSGLGNTWNWIYEQGSNSEQDMNEGKVGSDYIFIATTTDYID